MSSTLKDITERRASLVAEQKMRQDEYEKWRLSCSDELKSLSRRELMLTRGIDLERLDKGHAIIRIQGKVSDVRHGDYPDQKRDNIRAKAVTDARGDLARGAVMLRNEYIGVKNYDRFGDQREDHKIGYGPRHGSIVFSIRLTEDVRERLAQGGKLTPEEIEDALYVLATLDIAERADVDEMAD